MTCKLSLFCSLFIWLFILIETICCCCRRLVLDSQPSCFPSLNAESILRCFSFQSPMYVLITWCCVKPAPDTVTSDRCRVLQWGLAGAARQCSPSSMLFLTLLLSACALNRRHLKGLLSQPVWGETRKLWQLRTDRLGSLAPSPVLGSCWHVVL